MRLIPIRNLTALVVTSLAVFVPSIASAAPDRPATPPPTDFWNTKGFMLFAHQGGERENPGNTLFAFKKAVKDGADVIDMDVTLTGDGVLVATHDREPCHTSNAPCTSMGDPVTFRNQPLSVLRQYDFAYWFSPGLATYYDKSEDVPHPYRGMATGDVPPPEGYGASDFRIATFDEVLDAFPDTPINVELKPYTDPSATAAATAAVLADHPGRESDVIVNSFSQAMIEAFHTAAPDHLAMGGSLEGTLNYITGDPITPTPVAVEPPDKYNLPPLVDTLPILKPFFEYDGFISVVWPSDLDPTQETDPWYGKLISQGADAINTMFPSRLQEYLCLNGIPRPDGSPRCAQQECPAGQTGYAPDNCDYTPGQLTGFKVSAQPKKLAAGRSGRLKITLTNSGGAPLELTVALRSSNRQVKVKRTVKLTVPGLESITRGVPIKAVRKARGKAMITVRALKQTRRSVITVKARKKKQHRTGRR